MVFSLHSYCIYLRSVLTDTNWGSLARLFALSLSLSLSLTYVFECSSSVCMFMTLESSSSHCLHTKSRINSSSAQRHKHVHVKHGDRKWNNEMRCFRFSLTRLRWTPTVRVATEKLANMIQTTELYGEVIRFFTARWAGPEQWGHRGLTVRGQSSLFPRNLIV